MYDDPQKNILIIFAKLPEAGKVKTRLAKDLGEEKAAEIYSAIAKDIISRVSSSACFRTTLFFDPPDKKNEIISWLKDTAQIESQDYIQQEGSMLGERISGAFEKVFSNGAKKAVIIGTDCREVSAEMIQETFNAIKDHDIVIGPAEDGGYYLLGLRGFHPELFQGIDWSTKRVLEQTLARVKESGLSYRLLNTLRDIDNIDDLMKSANNIN